jgi:hypothetical protein
VRSICEISSSSRIAKCCTISSIFTLNLSSSSGCATRTTKSLANHRARHGG